MTVRRLLAAFAAVLLLTSCGRPATHPPKPRLAPDPALAGLQALFVGIDHYRFSTAHLPRAQFDDLAGAVGDVRRFKAALENLYGITLDRPVGAGCRSAGPASVTLLDGCAEGAAILRELNAAVDRARPGGTVLFYFAGHGSRYRDTAYDQDSGYNGTILGTDARDPQAGRDQTGEIFDTQLRAIKDRATRAGRYFVTIFDSCNSATATRNGLAGAGRSAPPLDPANLPPRPAPAGPAESPAAEPLALASGTPGYWVHFGAAQDGETASEQPAGAVGERQGVFTSALIAALTLPAIRHGTFGDIIREVRLRVSQGQASQTPSAEGELTAALGRFVPARPLFPARPENARAGNNRIMLEAGTLSGITVGSRFALGESQAALLGGRPPLAQARVVAVTPMEARLALDRPAPGLPPALVAREIAHFLPPAQLAVAVDLPHGPPRDSVLAALGAMAFARVAPSGTVRLRPASPDLAGPDPAKLELRGSDGTVLARLGRADAPGFAAALERELRKVARVEQLLALRTAPGERGGTAPAVPFALTTCVSREAFPSGACPAVIIGGVQRLGLGTGFSATLVNRGTRPAYLYLLSIDPLNGVRQVVPRRGEIDVKIAVNRRYRRSGIHAETPGIYRFVAIASDTPVRADAFEQAGNGTRGMDACASPLERLICAANDGLRDGGVAGVGDWSAEVTTVLVSREGHR